MIIINNTKNKRDVTFDIARSLCALWIVGVWHLQDYIFLGNVSDENTQLGSYITTSVLGAFTFMSGFFLKKYEIRTISDVKHFYKKRLLRLGIPYFIAAASIYIASIVGGDPWFDSPLNFLLSLIGLSVFFPPLPPTFWYVTMLILFYILTPLMLVPRHRLFRITLYTVIEILFILLWHSGMEDARCMIYFPMYALGLLVTKDHLNLLKGRKTILGVILCIPVMLGLLPLFISHQAILHFCWEVLALILLYVISNILSKNKWMRYIGQKVSYASMNMYLFHRHIYLFFIIAWNFQSMHNIHDAVMPIWFAVFVAIPVIILFSYYFNKGYDMFTSRYM